MSIKKEKISADLYLLLSRTLKNCVNQISYQGAYTDNAIKTERFGCVYFQELTEIMPFKTHFTTSKHLNSIFSTSKYMRLFY